MEGAGVLSACVDYSISDSRRSGLFSLYVILIK